MASEFASFIILDMEDTTKSASDCKEKEAGISMKAQNNDKKSAFAVFEDALACGGNIILNNAAGWAQS